MKTSTHKSGHKQLCSSKSTKAASPEGLCPTDMDQDAILANVEKTPLSGISCNPGSPASKEIVPSPKGTGSFATDMETQECHKDIAALSSTELRKKYKSEYNSWDNMKQRCKKKGYVLHPAFGNFKAFLNAMGPKPDPTYTLDRIDPANPEYSPKNCRWASKALQAANKNNTVYLKGPNGTIKPLIEPRQQNLWVNFGSGKAPSV